MRRTILRMIRRAIANKTISAIHLPIREPFLLFSLGLAGLDGLYIHCASLVELEHTNGCCTTITSIFLSITSQREEGCFYKLRGICYYSGKLAPGKLRHG